MPFLCKLGNVVLFYAKGVFVRRKTHTCNKVKIGVKKEFRPCIDIHNGKVKQIVGGSLKDEGNMADENFVSGQDAVFYANLYKKKGFCGGHIIL